MITPLSLRSSSAPRVTRCIFLVDENAGITSINAVRRYIDTIHVNPSISPIRKEQENARFRASNKIGSSQTSIAFASISAVQISRSLCSSLGRVAFRQGSLQSVPTHSLVKGITQQLVISRTVWGVKYSFVGLRLFTLTAFTLSKSR